MNHSIAPITYKAYGKVNLALSVLGRRQDGYHEVSTVMAAVDLFDLITVSAEGSNVSVCCPALPDLPQEQNLSYRAATKYLSRTDIRAGVHVRIDKGIPAGGGMGGGSSDAAAVLLALDNVFGSAPGTFATDAQDEGLISIARGLGADVPFFIGPNRAVPAWTAALCTGIGDVVTPVDLGCRNTNADWFWLAVLFLSQGVSTPWAFSAWDTDNPGKDYASGAERDIRPDAVLRELSSGNAESLAKVVYNDLEGPVVKRRGDVARARVALLDVGALNAIMTGSGSTVYGLCRSRSHAEEVRDKVLELKLGFLSDARVARIKAVEQWN